MPIYAYRCSNCGHAQDVLQRISDPVLTVCPACGEPTYVKQVTAAGFQLKGSGWYVTDFRDNKKPAPAADADKGGAKEGAEATSGAGGDAAPAADAAAKNGAAAKSGDAARKPESAASAPAAPSPASAPTPAAPAGGKTAD